MKKRMLFLLSILFTINAPTFIYASMIKDFITNIKIEKKEEPFIEKKKESLNAIIYDFLSREDYSYIYSKKDETGKDISHIVPYHRRAVEEALEEAKKVANDDTGVVIDPYLGEYSYQQLLDASDLLFDKVLGRYGHIRATAINGGKLKIILFEGEEWTEGRKNAMRNMTGMKEIIFTTHEEDVKGATATIDEELEKAETEK